MKISEEYNLFIQWCKDNNRPERSYNAFMHFKEFQNSLDKEQSGWISVEDRLPSERMHCLIYCPQSFPKNIRVLSATFYDDNSTFYCDALESSHEDVTHWMPLPQPPKEENRKK